MLFPRGAATQALVGLCDHRPMELRQLRYFVRIVELGSMGRAALDLQMVQSALSQQISRLEGELSTRLLQRTSKGTVPTEAGLAFFREAQLTLRHADQAARVARQARLSGTVTVGLAPTTASVLGIPLMRAMRERYPDVRLHMVESLSGHLASMLTPASWIWRCCSTRASTPATTCKAPAAGA